MLTRQGLYLPPASQLLCAAWPAFCAGDDVALDLNAQPEYIESISAIGQSWQPCPGGATAPKYDNLRTRGELVATVAVTWHNPMKPAQLLSGVFIAAQIDSCSPSENPLPTPGPLVFRDTANLVPQNSGYLFQATFGGIAGNDNFQWRWDSEPLMDTNIPPQPYLKLPRFMSHPDSGLPTPNRCRMSYLATAAAPSDSRVLYAWAHGDNTAGAGYCNNSSGLWRSLNRGLSWHPLSLQSDPQTAAGAWPVNAPILTVSPHSPYVAVVGYKGTHNFAQLYTPATTGSVIPINELPTVKTLPFDCPFVANPVIGDPNDPQGKTAWAVVNYEGIGATTLADWAPALPQPASFLRLVHFSNLGATGGADHPHIDIYSELFDWRQMWNGSGAEPPANPTTADLGRLVLQRGALRLGGSPVVRDSAMPTMVFGQANQGKPVLFVSLAGAGVVAVNTTLANFNPAAPTALDPASNWKVPIKFQACLESANCAGGNAPAIVDNGVCVTDIA